VWESDTKSITNTSITMKRIFSSTALIFMSGLRSIVAFRSISIPATVNANESVKLAVANDLSSGSSSFDAQFTTYRIYLAIIAPSSTNIPNTQQPSCYLVNATSINTTSPTIVVPPSVGPDGTSYSIASMEYNTNPHSVPPSEYEYSSTFTLYNATGSWSPADLKGDYPLFPDLLPCSAYDCARQCLAASFPGNINGTSFASTYQCMASCPGVTYPSWASVEAEGAAPGDALAGAGNDGASTILPAYASLLSSVSLLPTTTQGVNTTSASSSATAAATTTGTSEGVLVARGRGSVLVGVVAHLIAVVL
jgi:hypothetical protein